MRGLGESWFRPVACALVPATLLCGCYTGLQGGAGAEGSAGTAGDAGDASAGSSDGGTDTDPQAACADPQVGVTELRRLTQAEYRNTVRDLLGYEGDAADTFSADERVGPFTSNVGAPVSEIQVEQYMSAAESIGEWAAGQLPSLLPCDPAALGEDECANAFIADFAPRAYRRPLQPDELAALQQVYTEGKASGGFEVGVRLVIQGVLQSPWFLYHMEFGSAGVNDGAVIALDDHELASRLSYFLWNTMPDGPLFDAADAGELATEDGLAAQVDRMLADPRARGAIATFHLQWFGVDEVEGVEKNADAFPSYSPALAAAMREETAAFATHVVLDDDGLLASLLTAEYTLSDDPDLLALYGATLPPGHVAGEPVPLPAGQRAGLLTQASVMTRHAHVNQTSPVHRGKLVRENLLCQPLPPPPPDVDNTPPSPDPDATTRERFEQHRADPSCAGCHSLIDPIGFTFEHYDGIGAWRDVEAGAPVDASGELTETDVDGPVDGAVEMAGQLAQSTIVQQCVARQWFRFAFGRFETDEDTCTNDALDTAFTEANGDVRVLIRQLVLSNAFRYRRAEPAAIVGAQEEQR
ncbi:MAG: DUF1592 domain-containing protein [Nannocystaceae bacterium]|nr:DUF1592 domain-containing protein [Nannocystaceae bacterium]